MIPDHIERETLIEAPREVVWRVLTEPEQIVLRYCDDAQPEVYEGGAGVFTWTTGATSRPATANLRVGHPERPRRFAFRWASPDGEEPTDANSIFVEFTMADKGGHTRLHLIEQGLQRVEWAEDAKRRFVDEHERGWSGILARLQQVAGQQAASAAQH